MLGVAVVLVGQPFDTIKIRLQSQKQHYKNAFDCAKQILGQEGVSAFYKGSLSPILGSAFTLSLFYGFNSLFIKIMKKWGYDDDLPIGLVFMSGALSAFIQGTVSFIYSIY